MVKSIKGVLVWVIVSGLVFSISVRSGAPEAAGKRPLTKEIPEPKKEEEK